VNQKDVLRKAFEAIAIEERAIFLYARHLKVVLEWSGLPEPNKRQIREALDVLAKEIVLHESALSTLSAGMARENGRVE
jgi:hypothetical protein